MHLFQGNGQTLTPVVLSEEPDNQNRTTGPRDFALNDLGELSYSFDRQIAGIVEQPLGINRGGSFTPYTFAQTPIGGGVEIGSLTGAEGRTVLNNSGQVAFFATLTGNVQSGLFNSGLFLADETEVRLLLQEGIDFPLDPVFGSADDLQSLGGTLSLNDAGVVAFTTSGGVYRFDQAGLTRILANGDPALDGNGTYITGNNPVHGYHSVALNNAGQMAFQLTHQTNVAGTLDAIYLYDEADGLIQVAREGESFLGSTIQDLRFLADNTAGDEGNGFNDAGQIAFLFQLVDGRDGIGLYDANRLSLVGDFNGNGSVEQGDLNLVLNNWGTDRTFEDGTTAFTTNNVDQEELNAVLNNWGASAAPSFAGFDNIPEPAGLAALAGFALCGTRRRGRAVS
ncbi:MAG: choice-of-anchor tandem repeat NxxGxxAF-containing protein [Planctomycetota bacterium]